MLTKQLLINFSHLSHWIHQLFRKTITKIKGVNQMKVQILLERASQLLPVAFPIVVVKVTRKNRRLKLMISMNSFKLKWKEKECQEIRLTGWLFTTTRNVVSSIQRVSTRGIGICSSLWYSWFLASARPILLPFQMSTNRIFRLRCLRA